MDERVFWIKLEKASLLQGVLAPHLAPDSATTWRQMECARTPYINWLLNGLRCMIMYHVKIRKGKDGYYVVQCKELPAAITQGKTKKEALKNIREAIELVLEDMKDEIREKKLVLVEA